MAGTTALPGTGLFGTRTEVSAPKSTGSSLFGQNQTAISNSNTGRSGTFASVSNTKQPLPTFGKGTDVSGNDKTAGSGSLFAGYGRQTNTESTDVATFASGPGLFIARTDTKNASGGFGNNHASSSSATASGKNPFGSTSPFGQPATPVASTGGGKSPFGSTSAFAQAATPASSNGGLFGKSQTDQIDRPKSNEPSVSSSGGFNFKNSSGGFDFKNPNASGEGAASGKSELISYYTPTKGTEGWNFKAFDCDGLHEDYPEGFIRTWGAQKDGGIFQSLTAHKRFSLSSFEVSTFAQLYY
jgi:hypothetical protein